METGKLERCPDCPFGAYGPAVGGRGNPKGKLVFLAESPGKEEAQPPYEPLVGPSGQLVNLISPVKLDHPEVLVLNACKCVPGKKKNEAKLKSAVGICRPRLMAELQEYPREVIIAMGGGALWSVTGNYNLKPTQERGKILDSPLASAGIATSVHPAYLLRGTGSTRQFKEDLERGCALFSGFRKKPSLNSHYTLAVSDKDIKFWVWYLRLFEHLSADIETTGFDRQEDEVIALGVGYSKDRCVIFPRSVWQTPRKVALLRPLFDDTSTRFIWHNGKFDIAFMRREGLQARVDEDTMLLSYARDENGGIHDLEQLGSDILGLPAYKDMIKPYLVEPDSNYGDIPQDILHKYLAIDCSSTYQVWEDLHPQIMEDNLLKKLYTETLIPSSEFYYHSEARGLLVDQEVLTQNGKIFFEARTKSKEEIQTIAGYDINPNSWQQLAVLLYDEQKIKKYKSRRKTDKDTLAKLPQRPVVVAIQKYRKAQKAYGTYIEGTWRAIGKDGRVHPTILIHGTTTGRPASRNPNVLNIPRDPRLRGVYRAPAGMALLDYDLDQAELRVLAMLSGDEFLRSIYLENRKLHAEVATALFGVGYTGEQYMRAKAVNFGIPYGRGAGTLAEEFNISKEEGQQMIDDWFILAPKAKDFLDEMESAPLDGKSITTAFGQKRRFGVVSRENRHHILNEAKNFPMQSISNHIALHTGMRVRPILAGWGVFINNFVYDSLVMECPIDMELIANITKVIDQALDEVVDHYLNTDIRFTMSAKATTHWGNKDTKIELPEAA